LFFQESLNRVYKKEEQQAQVEEIQVDQKVKNIIGLKNSISQSRDNLKALQVSFSN